MVPHRRASRSHGMSASETMGMSTSENVLSEAPHGTPGLIRGPRIHVRRQGDEEEGVPRPDGLRRALGGPRGARRCQEAEGGEAGARRGTRWPSASSWAQGTTRRTPRRSSGSATWWRRSSIAGSRAASATGSAAEAPSCTAAPASMPRSWRRRAPPRPRAAGATPRCARRRRGAGGASG